MSMKDKALQVKQDFDDVYEAGKENIITNSKYIEKTASGKAIRLDDVSEVYHNVKVKADTPTEVKVYGKNLFKITNSTQGGLNATTGNVANSLNYILTTDYIRLASGDYVLSNKVGANLRYIAFYNIDKEFVSSIWTNRAKTYNFTANEDCYVRIDVEKDGNVAIDNRESFVKEYEFMLELGFIASPYEEYKEPQSITATPEGTEVPSNCPIMTFLADNDVTVDYYGSYGKAEAELAMWNGFTNNNTRTFFSYAFYGTDFSAYDSLPDGITIKPTQNSNYMFYSYRGTRLPDGFDLSELPLAYSVYLFGNSPKLEKVQDFGLTARKDYTKYFFYNKMLKEIVILRVSEDSKFDSTFQGCESLEKIIFSGTIASDINLQWSKKLDLESLISLFYCLKVYSSDNADYCTKTITLSAESWALTESQDFQDALGYTDGQAMCRDLGWNYA